MLMTSHLPGIHIFAGEVRKLDHYFVHLPGNFSKLLILLKGAYSFMFADGDSYLCRGIC